MENEQIEKVLPDIIELTTLKVDGKKWLRTLTKEGKNSNVTLLKGDIHPVRCSYTHDNRLSIIPYGGPTITEGEKLSGYDAFKVKKLIKYEDSYLIEIEDNYDILCN